MLRFVPSACKMVFRSVWPMLALVYTFSVAVAVVLLAAHAGPHHTVVTVTAIFAGSMTYVLVLEDKAFRREVARLGRLRRSMGLWG